MKSTMLQLTLGIALMSAPVRAQESVSPRPDKLDRAGEQLQRMAPDEAQSEALMQLLMEQFPRIIDANTDPAAVAREIGPQVERLLGPEQVKMLRQMETEMGTSTDFGKMGKDERRKLMKGGMDRLNHPSEAEWLKRIDSFDL